jgi:putative NADH-flavin reductase
MLFQNDIQNLQSEIANFEAVIAARRAQIEQLSQVSSAADDAVNALKDAVTKVSACHRTRSRC